MNKISRVLSKFILALFIVTLNFAIFRVALAQPDYITIDHPTGSSPPLAGTKNVGGTVMMTTSWIGLYLFDSQALTLTNASCALTTFPSYECVWDTTQVADGQHLIKTAAVMSGITYYSPGVSVAVDNGVHILPITPTPSKTPSKSPSPSPKVSPTPTPSPSMTTTQPIVGRPDLSPIPVAVPVTTPSPSPTTLQEMISSSQLLATIEFKLDQDKPLHLAKIDGRQTTNYQKFLLFSGKSFADSYLKITIKSQPLVMTAKADSSGSWQYVLDKPLEPGDHEVYVEVNNNGQIVQSGPYPFAIARAQAGTDNPTGASLNLIDPQKQALKNYLYLAGGLVALAILVMVFILYFKKIKKMRAANPPIKEPSAV